MKIKALNLISYGKFENKEIRFNDGLNVIYGKNGSGKSTLSTALKSFLYKELKGNGKYKKNYIPIGEKQGGYDVSFETDDGEEYLTCVTAGMTAAKTIHKTVRISDNKEVASGVETGEFFLGTKEDMYDSVCFIKDTADFEKVSLNNETVNEKLSGSFDDERASVDITDAIENLTKEKLAFSRQTSSGLIYPKEEELSEVKETLNTLLKISEDDLRMKKEEEELKNNLESEKEKNGILEAKLKAHEKYREYEKYLQSKKTKDTAERIKKELESIKVEKCQLDEEEISKLKEITDSSADKKYFVFGLILAAVFAIAGIFVPVVFIAAVISAGLGLFLYLSDKKKKDNKLKEHKESVKKILFKVNCSSYEEYAVKNERYKKALSEKESLEKQLSDILALMPSEDIKEITFASEPEGEYYEIRKQFDDSIRNINELKLLLASTEERRKNLFNNLPSYEEQVARKEELETEIENLKEEERVTLTALKMMEITRERYKTSYLPLLSKRAEEILLEAEKNADKLILDEKFSPSLREKDEIPVKEKEHLSSGISDSVYFALKLAVVDIAFKDKEKPVLILDDPFVRMDDERAGLWIKYLMNETDFQIILFTAGKRIFNLGLEKDTILEI